MTQVEKQIEIHDIDEKVKAIINNEKLTNYEKALQIVGGIICPILNQRDELKEKNEELLGCISY